MLYTPETERTLTPILRAINDPAYCDLSGIVSPKYADRRTAASKKPRWHDGKPRWNAVRKSRSIRYLPRRTLAKVRRFGPCRSRQLVQRLVMKDER
jgi:hypothetical protein